MADQSRGFDIVFENSEIVLVNKAAGLAVQGGERVSHSLDVELSRYMGHKAHLVHRLDKDTAGLILVAKDAPSAAKWSALISSRHVQKRYIAVCFGYPVVQGKRCPRGVLKSAVSVKGRCLMAQTHFSVERTAVLPLCSGDKPLELCVVRAVLDTGRTHQIRVQLAAAGCPIIADDKHGDFALNRAAGKLGIRRLQLAATSLKLPLEGGVRTFTIEPPPHIERTLSLIGVP